MKNYWYIVSLSITISILTIQFQMIWFGIIFILWLYYLFYQDRLRKLHVFVSLIAFILFLFYLPSKDLSSKPILPSNKQSEISGKITGPILYHEKRIEFTFQSEISNEKIQVTYFPQNKVSYMDKEYRSLKTGAQCDINGKLQYPNESRNPGQFDYQEYLTGQGISFQLTLRSIDDIQCQGSSWINLIYTARLHVLEHVTNLMSHTTEIWLKALVLGDKSNIDDEVINLFQRWGLSHLLAISGLHVGLIISFLYFLLVKLSIVTKENAQWFMIVFLPFYAFLAGGEPSVWRASMMVFTVLILNKLQIKIPLLDALSIVFILLVLFDKYIIYHVGFQFSFLVTFSLIISQHLLRKIPSLFFQGLYISFISQMVILPLQIAYFFQFQPLSILFNVIIVPYFSLFVIPILFLILILSFFIPFLLAWIDLLFVSIHELVLQGILLFDSIANKPLVMGEFPASLSLLYFVFFFLFLIFLQKNNLWQAFQCGLMLIAVILVIKMKPFLSSTGVVTMLDIGQGDAFVIELPYRKGVYLIDAGARVSFDETEPSDNVYKQIIKPYLFSRGIDKIDAILLSHEHEDHIGSVPFIIKEISVNEIILSDQYVLDESTELLWEKLGITTHRVRMGDQFTLHDQLFHVLSPNQDLGENENSLVLYTKLGDLYWLFTGDIYKNIEEEIINHYPNLQVDVLKVAHHGSKTSTDEEFISLINPKYALIPVGKNNLYGHPNEEVLEVLEANEIIIFRSDKDGAVQFHFNQKDGTFTKYIP